MDRAAALSYLSGEYRELAGDAGLLDVNQADAYVAAIDMSLRQLGVAEPDLAGAIVGQPQIITFYALLDYFALRRFVRLLAGRFDVQDAGTLAAKRSQAFTHVQKLLQEAEARLVQLGISVGASPAFSTGRLNLDFLEPSGAGEF